MVAPLGLAPRSLAALDFKSKMFTNFIIGPFVRAFNLPYIIIIY
jgi:hypothetical protein